MPNADTFPYVSDSSLEELAERGEAIYTKFQHRLEAEHYNQYVVFHVDNEDYAVGRSFYLASRAMRERHPADGRLYGRKIGPEPDEDREAMLLLLEKAKAEPTK